MTTKTRIAISVALQNTGQATRALEIAKGLQECTPTGHEVAITFLSHGSWFEPYVREAGFDIMRVQPEVEGRSTDEDMRFDPPELIGSVEWAKAFINGQRQAMRELRPDVVIHSFWQVGSIAAQLEGIPTISFLPVPPSVVVAGLHRSRLGLVEQHNLTQAIIDSGWQGRPPTNIYDQIRADLTIINDLPSFYTDTPMLKDVWITGPLFAHGTYGMPMDTRLLELLTTDDGRPKILLTMGSSGTRQALLEATTAIASGAAAGHWTAVILASPSIVRMAEVKQIVQDCPSIFVTDEFVSFMQICEMADVVVCHGGQATIQTALACGTPIVGVPMQMEQQINLDHVAAYGAGITVPSDRWRTSTIQAAIRTVIGDPGYRLRAQELAHIIHSGYGKRPAGECIWQWIDQGLTVPTAMAGMEFPL